MTIPISEITGLQGTLDLKAPNAMAYAALADHAYIGFTITGIAGETLAVGQPVYLKAADSRWWKTRANASGTMSVAPMIVVVGGNAADTVTLLKLGYLRDDSFSLTVNGATIYAGDDTAGTLITTAPSDAGDQVQVLGKVTDVDNIIEWNPDPTIITVGVAVLTVPSGGTGLNTVAANSYLKGADAGALVPRTYAEVKTDLGLNNVDNTSNATERAAAATLTNKRITSRVATITDGATIAVDCDNYDVAQQSNTQTAGTLTVSNPTGTPTPFQRLAYYIKNGAGGTQTFSFGNNLLATADVALPISMLVNTKLKMLFIWDSIDSHWYLDAKVAVV